MPFVQTSLNQTAFKALKMMAIKKGLRQNELVRSILEDAIDNFKTEETDKQEKGEATNE